jgi:hypothetical protein
LIENVSALLSAATSTATVGIITSNICFKAGTKIVTDQGIVNIEKITTEKANSSEARIRNLFLFNFIYFN